MNLYLVSSGYDGYDTYDSVVVAAKSKKDARTIHPSEFVTHHSGGKWMGTYSGGKNIGQEYENETSCWVNFIAIESLDVELIGKTEKPRGVILASFNAG